MINAYSFLKEINEKIIAVVVNLTDEEYVTSTNPIEGQIKDIESEGNIGLDTHQSIRLILRLRGPKGPN